MRGLFLFGKVLSGVVGGIASGVSVFVLGLTFMFALAGPPGASGGASVLRAAVASGCLALVIVRAVRVAAVVVHECGHLLACLAFRVKVREFRIGRPGGAAYRFGVRGVTVALGRPFAGKVEHDPVPSRWRSAVIVVAGSLANLVAAGGLLAAGLATGVPRNGVSHLPVHQAVELSLAVIFAATGTSSLMPFTTKRGSVSDGARLLALGSGRLARALRRYDLPQGPKGAVWRPANAEEAAEFGLDSAVLKRLAADPGAKLPPELLDKWLAAYRDRTFVGLVTAGAVGRALRKDGRVTELLQLLEEYPAPYGRLAPAMTGSMHDLAYEVALLPGMPPHVVNMAADRLQRVIDACDSIDARNIHLVRAAMLHSMAVARLRQGNFDMVEHLCRQRLGAPELPPSNRATILATVALARQALGQPYDTLLAEAITLDSEADLVAEASWRSGSPGSGGLVAGVRPGSAAHRAGQS